MSQQQHVIYNYLSAYDASEMRHAQIVMKELAETFSFRIIRSCGQPLVDGFEFWIECNKQPDLPDYIRFLDF